LVGIFGLLYGDDECFFSGAIGVDLLDYRKISGWIFPELQMVMLTICKCGLVDRWRGKRQADFTELGIGSIMAR